MTLRMIYDDGIPLSEDFSEADYYYAIYDHAIPLQSPLGVEVSFGPYSASVGSNGAAADYYWISVFDVIEPYPNFSDISESIGINIEVSPGSVILRGPPGFHDLELYGIYYNLRNFYGEDFLVGTSIPAGFPEFNWEDILLTVDVMTPSMVRRNSVLEHRSLDTDDSTRRAGIIHRGGRPTGECFDRSGPGGIWAE